MAKDDEQSSQLNLTVVALVALVAIVGLVALVLNTASLAKISTGAQVVSAASEEDLLNVVGAAGSACANWATDLCRGRTGRNCKEYYTSLCQYGSVDGTGQGGPADPERAAPVNPPSGGGVAPANPDAANNAACGAAGSVRKKRCLAELE